MKVRDKLWLFASRAHDDDIWLRKSRDNRFTRRSRITPAEGAAMLDVPNVIMAVSDGVPVAFPHYSIVVFSIKQKALQFLLKFQYFK